MGENPSDLLCRLTKLTAARVLDREWRMQRFATLLEASGPRLTGVPLVKVTGTNGKGSVCAMLEACLGAAGRRVGLFTSPHLERITERIRIGGREVDTAVFADNLNQVERFLANFLRYNGEHFTPSFFEALLLLSREAFATAGVDFAIYEAGVGGAHDPTSLLPGFFSVLTTVAFDHEAELGDTLIAIATEKTGIASPHSTLVLGPKIQGEVQAVAERVSHMRGTRVVAASRNKIRVREQGQAGSTLVEVFPADRGKVEVRLPLRGEFQLDNLATVATIVEVLQDNGILDDSDCISGVANTRWAARMEHVLGAPSWLLDGAHNEEAIGALAGTIGTEFADRDRVLVFGSTARKTYTRYLPRLGEIAPEVWITDDFDDAEDREVIARALDGSVQVGGTVHLLSDLLDLLQNRYCSPRSLIVVAGSLYLVGKARGWLVGRGLIESGR